MVKHCSPISVLKCFYLTKENKDEFINILRKTYENVDITIEEKSNKYIFLKFELKQNPNSDIDYSFYNMYYYNYWYVEEYNYFGDEIEWNLYSDEDFNRRFKFVNDKEYEVWRNLWK